MYINLLGFFKTFFEPQFSRVSSVREKEEQAHSFFLRYAEECEGMDTVHTYIHILQYLSAYSYVNFYYLLLFRWLCNYSN